MNGRWRRPINRRLLPAILLALGICRIGLAQREFTPDPIQERLIQTALSKVYIDSFPAALSCLDSILSADSGYLPAQIIKAGVIYMDMTDDENYGSQRRFRILIDSATTAMEKHLADNPRDAWGHFFMGTALGYQAFWEGQHGSWFKAISRGLKAGKYFSHALEYDTTFYDAYIGLGNLHYWRSAKMGILRNLPFVPDQRHRGIEELILAIQKSRLSPATSAIGLGWIYVDRKEYDMALALTDSLIKEGICGRQVQWLKGFTAHKIGRADKAVEAFETIKNGLIGKGGQNKYNLIICGYYLGMAYYLNGEKDRALKNFDEILDYELSPMVARRAAKTLARARELKQKIMFDSK